MPARALRVIPELPPRVDDPQQDLRNILAVADPAQLAAWYARLSPEQQALVDRILAREAALGWRANPATMMVHLDGVDVPGAIEGDKHLWPYVEVLGRKFADLIYGIDDRQQWRMPSQYGKTTMCCQWGPIWALDANPRLRIMYVTYDEPKAIEEGGKTRDIAEHYADTLRFKLRPDRRARAMWRTDQGGGLYATSINGGITGYPADVIVGDDLISGWQAAHSEAERNRAWNVFISQMRLRLQGQGRSSLLLAGTAWHEDDVLQRARTRLTGRDRMTLTRLPATADEPTADYPEPDPLGRKPGEILEPRRFDEEEVRARATFLGTYLTSAMEQGRPAPEAGTDVLRAWFKLDDVFPLRYGQWAASWDMKLKDKEAGDYVVGGVWGRTGGDYWLLDVLRGQWNQATVKAGMALIQVRYPQVRRQYVENTGNAPETMDELRKATPGYVVSADVQGALGMTDDEARAVERIIRRGMSGLTAVTPKGDKRVRMRAVSPIIEAGNVHLPKPRGATGYEPARGQWVETYLAEMAAFPNGTHDDQVDMTSQALSKMARLEASVESPAGRRVAQPKPGRTAAASGGVRMPSPGRMFGAGRRPG